MTSDPVLARTPEEALEIILDKIGEVIIGCIQRGMQTPLTVVLVDTAGSVMAWHCEEGTSAAAQNVIAHLPHGGMVGVMNVAVFDGRAEAARFVISVSGKVTQH